jgi:hypothetical protein
MTDGPEYLESDLVDVGAANLAELGSLDPNLLAASLEQVLRRVRRPAAAIAGFTQSGPEYEGDDDESCLKTVTGRDLAQ